MDRPLAHPEGPDREVGHYTADSVARNLRTLEHAQDEASPVPGATLRQDKFVDRSERRALPMTEFYEGVAQTISDRVQSLRKQTNSQNAGIEAMTLAAHLMDRATEPSFLQGENALARGLSEDDRVRGEIGYALMRATEMLLDAPKYAGQRVLLFNGEDCTPEQALVITTELERLFGTTPTEDAQKYESDIDGVGIVYEQTTSPKAHRRKIEMTYEPSHAETRDLEVLTDVFEPPDPSRPSEQSPEALATNATAKLFSELAAAVPAPQETFSDGVKNAAQNAAVLRQRLDIRADHASQYPVAELEGSTDSEVSESLRHAIDEVIRFAAPRRGQKSENYVLLFDGPIRYHDRAAGDTTSKMPTEDIRIATLMRELQWLLGASVASAKPEVFQPEGEHTRVSHRVAETDIDPRFQFIATHVQVTDEQGQPQSERLRIALQTPIENATVAYK